MKFWCEVLGGSGNCKIFEVFVVDGIFCGNNKVCIFFEFFFVGV